MVQKYIGVFNLGNLFCERHKYTYERLYWLY